MKSRASQIKSIIRKDTSFAMALLILITSLFGSGIFRNEITTQAATVFDKTSPSTYKELVNEDFTDGAFDADKWLNPYNAAQLSAEGLKINNPNPGFTAAGTAPSYLSNILWVDKSLTSADQHVETEINFSDNPTAWNNDLYVHLWARTSMGEKFGGTNRGEHNRDTGGYHLRISTGKNISIDVLKRLNNSETSMMKICYDGSYYLDSRPGTYRFELNVTGSNPTVINARILEKSGSEWKVVRTNTCYDSTATQITSGTAGLGMYTNGCANAYVQNFRYITTDVPEGKEETFSYVKKTATDTTGRLFAQVVTLNPAKKYQLTAYTDGLEQPLMERFWIEYYSNAGPSQGGNLHRLSIDVPTLSQIDGAYVASTKVFSINEYVASKGASPAMTSGDTKWGAGDTANRANVIVGFRLDAGRQPNGNMSREATLAHFELYEIDEEGKKVGGNLILNPDFKLGLYGWNDNQEKCYINYTTNEVGDSTSAKNLVTCYTCTKDEYDSMFKKVEVDLNNTYYKLNKDKELNVTYMGGSVVTGHGASDPDTTSWRGLTNAWLKETYPDATINARDAAVGSTGSHFALYNYSKVPHETDLLILGASPNDFYIYNNAINGEANPDAANTYDYVYRHVESLISLAYGGNPNIDIVIVLLCDHWRINDATYLKAYTDIANKYKLPLVDMRVPLKKRAEKDGLAWSSDGLKPYRTNDNNDAYEQLFMTNDGVHPIDAGYKLYGEHIISELKKLLNPATKPTSLTAHSVSSEILDSIVKEPNVVTANNIPLSDGWTHSKTKFSYMNEKFGDTYSAESGFIKSSKPGATLTYTFTGTDFGFMAKTGPSYGKVYIEIDGVPYKKGNNGSFSDGVITFNRTNSDHRTQIVMWNQADKEHTVTIKLLEGSMEIGVYFVGGKVQEGSGSGSGGGDGEGDGDGDPDPAPNPGDWILSGNASYTNNILNIKGSTSGDSYLKNYAFNKNKNINQRISIDTYVTKGTATQNFDKVLWVRADFDNPADPTTITGYYAVYSINRRIELHKRYKDGSQYKDALIGYLYQNNDTRKFRYELVAEAVGEQTRLTVTTSKYGSDGNTLFLMSRNTFFDDTASLQDAGYGGVSLKVTQDQSNLTCSMENVVYTTTDTVADKMVYISKPKEPSANATFGQMLALDPAKTYVLSASVTAENQKLFVEYNCGSSQSAYMRVVTNGGEIDTSDGYRRVTAEFNINDFVAATGSPAAYVDGGYVTADGTGLAMVIFGFRLNNTEDMAYADITLYEKDDSLKRNLLTNPDFKMGMYGYCDGMNGTFISHNLGAEGSSKSYNNRVSIVNCSKSEYDRYFRVSTDEEEKEDFDYENYDGEYMLYCYDESSYNYGKFGQVIELEKGKTYVYSVKYKYVLQKQVAPIALYYKDPSMSGASRATLKWKTEEKDIDNSIMTYTFTVPDDAFLSNNKTKMLIGLTLGEIGGINYFRNFTLYEKSDSKKTNLFKNADFKQGLYGWIHTTGYALTPEMQKNIYEDTELALVILPVNESLFINDTNDRPWNDGKWYTKFGPDDKVETEEPQEDIYDNDNDIDYDTDISVDFEEDTDEEVIEEEVTTSKKQVQKVYATRKIYKQGAINIPATVALIAGIALGATALAGGIFLLVIKKRKKKQ